MLRPALFDLPRIIKFEGTSLKQRHISSVLGSTLVAIVLGCFAMPPAHASKEHWEEYEKIVGSAKEISPHGNSLLGDQISLQNGALSFSVSDVSLRGNNALRVDFTRTFATKTRSGASRGSQGSGPNILDAPMGDWEIDLPNIGGVFALSTGWISSAFGQAAMRCSVTNPVHARSPNVAVGQQIFSGSEIWQGTRINLPGRGNSAMLVRTQTLPQPSGANAYWITSDWTSVSCLPNIANGPGEGFLATDSDGNKYRFDWLAIAAEQRLAKKNPVRGGSPAYYFLDRGRYALYATRVEDKFGNWVTYSYSNAASAAVRLDRIESSDGRVITMAYAGGRLSSVSAHGRSWSYAYDSLGSLTTVTLPDNSAWAISLPNFQNLMIRYVRPSGTNGGYENDPYRSCTDPGELIPETYVGSIKHPAGATGTFTVYPQRFVKDGINYATNCATNNPNTTNDDEPYFPMAWDSYVIGSKSIGGPGLAPATWSYSYDAGRSTEVRGPGEFVRYTYGNLFRNNEAKLYRVERGGSAAQILEVQDLSYELAQSGLPFPAALGQSGHPKTPDWSETYLRPEKQSVYLRQGTTFSRVVGSFDSFARPLVVSRASTSSGAATKTEAVEYHDHIALWVLGQRRKVTVNSTVVAEESTFESSYGLPVSRAAFGKNEQTLSYDLTSSPASGQRGTLAAVTDGAGKTTTAANWKRGFPQSIGYADGTSQSAVVSDNGWITSARDENGFQTCYAYDAMGRLQQVTYPEATGALNCGTAVWLPTTLSFQAIPAVEFGIAAGHWRQVVTTGNAVKATYFDGMWRPLMTREFDASNEGNTRSVVLRYFDSENRKVFESYPQREIESVTATPPGTVTHFDALGRVTQTLADSELGWLTTNHTYPSGFRSSVTDPRGNVTTTTYRAFDNPEQAHVVAIAAPEGANVSINRDAFDKPTLIMRSGVSQSVSRTYVYDAHQRLCKTIEPESGATLVDYDGAGNLIWRAAGASLTALTCDRFNAPADRKISHTYDLRNRLLSSTYSDSSQNISRQYTPDGLLRQVVAFGGGGNTISWTYGYNSRRLLSTEQYGWGDPNNNWTFTYNFDSHGNLSGMSDPWGPMWYSPNALGQPTQVSGYASGISYHPNRALAGYTLANGVVFGMSQYVRGLPAWWTHSGVSNDLYQYDANGNISAIWDYQGGGSNNRSMGYDGRDRLTVANGPWGGGNFAYDAIDNIVASTVGGRSLVHQYDAANRLVGLSGSQNIGIGYDAQGNVTSRAGQGFAFDIGNRMRTASGKASYFYDGHGRRNLVWYAAPGDYAHQAYTQDGKLRFGWRSTQGGRRHVYLGDKLIAETTDGWHTQYFHADALGSPIAKTNSAGAVADRTRYEPYGPTVAGSTNPAHIGFTGHVNDVDTGLVYMQQRYYDPIAGRFLSVDPVTTDAKRGGHFNRYAYADNNPYKYTDPDGRSPVHAGLKALDLAVSAIDIMSAFHTGGAGAGIRATADALLSVPGARAGSAIMKGLDRIGGAAKEITLSRSIHGEAAAHAADAIKAGKPSVLTIDRAGAAANRQASTGALDKVAGKHLDEYPPAMFREGGAGASVRPINPRDNMSSGACIGNACRGLPDGTRIQIKIGD